MRTNGPYQIDNLLVPIPDWGVGGTVAYLDWGGQPGGRYGSFSVPWCGAIPTRPAYLPRSPENTRATARRVCDGLLRENCLERVQSISDSCHLFCDRLVNQTNCAWDDLWDEPVED